MDKVPAEFSSAVGNQTGDMQTYVRLGDSVSEEGVLYAQEEDQDARFVGGGSSSSGENKVGPLDESMSVRDMQQGIIPVECDDTHEEAAVVTKRTPPTVSKEEKERHVDAGHMPYREWCPDCVAGRGRADNHRRVNKEGKVNNEVSMDYCFPHGKQEGYATYSTRGEEPQMWIHTSNGHAH